ncbi:MAG: diguanylate cyclase (GGDEF)-like protein/PAS domain S-box-containing protein [Motiliproteus sp.]|jgi:diguanylate cyclase (GGDEF)-like protein/PAS domain S-box-containing protein
MIHSRIRLLILPMVLLTAATLTVALIINQASTEQDREADSLYRSFIRSSIIHEAALLRDQALDYAWWDDAARNLLQQQDLEWADANIGSNLYDHFNIQTSLVVTADNQIPIGFINGKLQRDLGRFSTAPALQHLRDLARDSSLQDPEGASGLVKIAGQLYLVGAFAFTPESTVQTQRSGIYLSVLLLMRVIDADFIQQHSLSYNLQLLSLDLSVQAQGLLLSSALDEPLATLSYQAPRPGEQLLDRVAGSLLGLILIFLLLFASAAWIIARVTTLNQRINLEKQALAEEVSRHQQALQQLRMSHEVLKSTSEAVVVTDSQGVIVEVNQAYCQLTGFSREQVLGKNPNVHKSDRHNDDFYRQMWSQLLQHGQWRGEVWDRRSNGEVYPKWLSISAIKNDQQHTSHYVGVFSDITERKDQEERLQRLALYDALTNLPNRLLFKERVEQRLLKARRDPTYKAALLFLDLDHFKDVNDSLGHLAGDRLLIEAGTRIQECIRSSDAVGRIVNDPIAARMGGDEFTIAIDIENNAAVAIIIERLRMAFSEAVVVENQPVFVSISIGISVFPDDGNSYEQLVNNADKAMYRAKRSGRNQFKFFSAGMDNIANGRIELESGLRQAIREQHFILHYQPKIDAHSGGVSSMEALIRWQHPDKGLIPPGDFIQVAEDTGLILPIGEWIIDTACHQVALWSQQLSRPLKVAVNLSARQFMDPLLLEKIIAALARSGLPPQQLELEVTESVMIEDMDAAINVLSKLQEIGISVAVDDFGTGYSSLNYLRKLPLDTLKIDCSFTARIDQDPKMAAIVRAIIHMGQSLELEVVAEGVETHEQKELLQYYGCHYLQGFLFSRPLEVSAMLAYLQQPEQSPPPTSYSI